MFGFTHRFDMKQTDCKNPLQLFAPDISLAKFLQGFCWPMLALLPTLWHERSPLTWRKQAAQSLSLRLDLVSHRGTSLNIDSLSILYRFSLPVWTSVTCKVAHGSSSSPMARFLKRSNQWSVSFALRRIRFTRFARTICLHSKGFTSPWVL